jgi:C4-dicarboxylate-specific signal transduction histidine kinase
MVMNMLAIILGVIAFGMIVGMVWVFSSGRTRTETRKGRDDTPGLTEAAQVFRETHLEKIDRLYRFAEFGELASGLFHDALNIFHAVLLSVESSASMPHIARVQEQIERFRTAIRRQLHRDNVLASFSLVETVEQVMQLVSYRAKKQHVTFRITGETAGTFYYFGNVFKWHQVMMNLITNALEAFDDGRERDRRTIAVQFARHGANYIVSVEDNGAGIAENILNNIFDPFFTTKKDGQGTGIGLLMTRHIIEHEFDGMIAVTSVAHEGTRFTIHIPMREFAGAPVHAIELS